MSEFWIVTICLVAMGLFTWWAWKRKQRGTQKYLPFPVPTSFSHTYRTPLGVKVESIVEVPSNILDLIDSGIRAQVERVNVKYPNWSKYKNYSDYRLIFVEPMAVSTQTPGAPLLIAYQGVTCSGLCIGVASDGYKPPTMVLPHQEKTNWRYLEYLENTARYESEHIREWANDQSVFYYWLQQGDVHPHYE